MTDLHLLVDVFLRNGSSNRRQARSLIPRDVWTFVLLGYLVRQEDSETGEKAVGGHDRREVGPKDYAQ